MKRAEVKKNSVDDFGPRPLQIGKTLVAPPLILAPMAAVTDLPYRHLMAEHGAGLVTTEMISTEGLRRNQPATWRLLSPDPSSSVPLAVQLFGSNPQAMVESAKRVEQEGVLLIDINAGCPVRKVVRQGAGAHLLREPDRLVFLVEQLKKAVAIPITVKIRLGWDSNSINVVEVAKRLSSAGADAVTIHARTAAQHYSGQADWSWIAKVKESVDIPVIGNGDITSPSLADLMLEQTGCDAVMVGRATMGNPWLLSAIASRWGYGTEDKNTGWEDFYETVCDHLDAFRANGGSKSPGHFRKILIWYSKGCPDASPLRARLMEMNESGAMLAVFHEWVEKVTARGVPFLSFKVPETVAQQTE